MDKSALIEILELQTLAIWKFSCKRYPQLKNWPIPQIELCNRLWRTAGLCYQQNNVITLGFKFFRHSEAYKRKMFLVILPHEIAHQVDYNIYGESDDKSGHGTGWNEVMKKYGLPSDPYHDMDIPRK